MTYAIANHHGSSFETEQTHWLAFDGERFFSGEMKDPKCGKMALCLNLSK